MDDLLKLASELVANDTYKTEGYNTESKPDGEYHVAITSVDLKETTEKGTEWFAFVLTVLDGEYTTQKFYVNLFLTEKTAKGTLSKIMNLDKAKVEGGLKFTMPSRFNFIVNQLSFLTDEKFKALNKNDSNIHYKDWIKEIQKVQIQVGQLKNFLIQLVETQRQL